MKPARNTICAVAIARDEGPFIDEWLSYHRLLGIDHFLLYDDDPDHPLAHLSSVHADYTTVIPWCARSDGLRGRNRQTKAYWHACVHYGAEFDWMVFIDIDEFIVLRKHDGIHPFLRNFDEVEAITLNWHVFGHSGFFEDPKGLVTANLVRRMSAPSPHGKTIARPETIVAITSAHAFLLHPGARWVDANLKPFTPDLYPGKTAAAHINHYQCRSFTRWMRRVGRGDVTIDPALPAAKDDRWRVDEQACLRQFVETVAFNKNEFVDKYMLRYSDALERARESVANARPRESLVPTCP